MDPVIGTHREAAQETRKSSAPFQGAVFVFAELQACAKNAYAWLRSQHASGVR